MAWQYWAMSVMLQTLLHILQVQKGDLLTCQNHKGLIELLTDSPVCFAQAQQVCSLLTNACSGLPNAVVSPSPAGM